MSINTYINLGIKAIKEISVTNKSTAISYRARRLSIKRRIVRMKTIISSKVSNKSPIFP
jgi:hypothetical protein